MYNNINFFEYQNKFSSDSDCRKYLFESRWPNGFECPKCQCNDHSYISSRELYQCSNCRYQCSVIVGTIFESTKTPLFKWFWMIFLIANSKNGYSSSAFTNLLSIAYGTALSMTHKIRTAMAARDAKYQLAGLVEMDDAFFGGKNHKGKRGRGSENKSTVIVGVQLSQKNERPQYIDMIKVENLLENTVKEPIKEHVKSGSTLKTDGYSTYKVLKKYNYKHIPLVVGKPENASKLLPWVHIMIANAKGNIRGTHHGVSPKHLQKYLSEFCYRFNRRYQLNQRFDRLLCACALAEPVIIAELFA